MLDHIKAKIILWVLKGVPNDVVRRKMFILAAKQELNKYLMEDKNMDGKSKWQSKAVWCAIVTGVLAMVQPVSTALGHPITIPNYVYEVLAGIGLYTLRDGVGKPLS